MWFLNLATFFAPLASIAQTRYTVCNSMVLSLLYKPGTLVQESFGKQAVVENALRALARTPARRVRVVRGALAKLHCCRLQSTAAMADDDDWDLDGDLVGGDTDEEDGTSQAETLFRYATGIMILF